MTIRDYPCPIAANSHENGSHIFPHDEIYHQNKDSRQLQLFHLWVDRKNHGRLEKTRPHVGHDKKMGGRRSFLSSLIALKFSCSFHAFPSERIWGRVGNKGQLRLIDLTWTTSLALCVLPYIWGLYATLISVPSVPDGGSSPYAGVTVKSGSELGAKNASNGRVCLKKGRLYSCHSAK